MDTIRFPLEERTREVPAEADQIIVLLQDAATLPGGGIGGYVSVEPWKQDNYSTEVPYTCVVIEWIGTAEAGGLTIGDGTPAQEIGLYGRIGADGGEQFLLGILGVSLGQQMPQIPIFDNDTGYAQIVSFVGLYDALAIGGVVGNIPVDGGTVTVRARPIRRRVQPG